MGQRTRVRNVFGLCLVLAWGWYVGPAAAQEPLGNEKAIKEAYNQNFSKVESLISGGTQYTDTDKAVCENAAKKFVYQFTWRDTYRNKAQPPQTLHKSFQDKMDRAGKPESDNQAFLDAFALDLIKYTEALAKYKIDDNDSRQVSVNIALLLPALGRCKHEAVGDFLADIVADPKQHLLYRFCAVKGLREFFPVYRVTGTEDPTDKRFLLKKDRATRRVDAVLAYINQDWKYSPNAPKEERDAVFFQRREGVRTLAQAQTPAIEIEKGKTGQPVKAWGPAAYGLMKILLNKEGLTPPASLAERCEAAIGLCQLKANTFESYQSPLAVALIGQLTVDFITKYNEDYPNINNKKIALLPWRVYSDRLSKALDEFPRLLPRDSDAQRKALEWIGQLKAQSATSLKSIKLLQPVEAPQELEVLVGTFQSASSYVFEDVPGMSLKAGKK